ncbi:hypothetical protein MPSEU_000245600 [Mayamaea pseudoterrestris]|nr:hypothetical protein MPSEU_000245600 [Mayamaea pseudoterrestris]
MPKPYPRAGTIAFILVTCCCPRAWAFQSLFTPQITRNPTIKGDGRSLSSQYVPLDGNGGTRNNGTAYAGSFPSSLSSSSVQNRRNDNDIESLLEFALPTITPILAFFTYEYVAQGFNQVVEIFSDNKWYAVDGGQLQAKIIAPAVNGIVVPAIALLFATLTSTSISTLRQRQVDIRKCINLEAGELRSLGHMIYVFPEGPVRDLCRSYLLQYVNRLLNECRATVSDASDVIDPRKGMDTELNGLLLQLNEGYNNPIPSHLADQSFAAVTRLREQRLIRITALQSTYPMLHWVTLGALAFAACVCFLIETNQDILYFLQAFQLKLLWATLIGTFVSCFTVFYDLGSPFAGQYKITASIEQLHTIKVAFKAALAKPESVALFSNAIADYQATKTTTSRDAVAVADALSIASKRNAFSDSKRSMLIADVEDSSYFPPKAPDTSE